MSQKVLIVGAGGFGREMNFWLSSDSTGSKGYTVVGFLDDNMNALDGFPKAGRVIASIRDYQPQADVQLLMAIANPKIKMKIGAELVQRGCRFLTYVHSTSQVGPTVSIGDGTVICPRVSIPCDATVGDFVTVNTGCTIGHDASVGDGSTLSGHCDVTGGVQMGKRVFLGSSVAIIPQIRIGDDAKIGAGSVVMTHIKPETAVFGVPAKRL